MLVRHAMTLGLSPEAMKAWSQNLGHGDVLTTFTSYGQVPVHRQGELVRASCGHARANDTRYPIAELEAVLASMRISSQNLS